MNARCSETIATIASVGVTVLGWAWLIAELGAALVQAPIV